MGTLEVFRQGQYLTRIIRDRVPCTVIMTNGYQMHDVIITADDGDAVLIEEGRVREQMVYKHAISTIRPPYPLCAEAGDGRAGHPA